ncbi:MAG: hypothetical protein HC875_20480 [Anaerolineales bacterium]|nr:hypothetical protein [Anaerolineales bacterium]
MIYDKETASRIIEEIGKKFGEKCNTNPKDFWNEEKEKKFQEDKKSIEINEKEEITETDKLIVKKKLFITKKDNNNCPLCKRFNLGIRDEVCLIKFNMCENCYDTKKEPGAK